MDVRKLIQHRTSRGLECLSFSPRGQNLYQTFFVLLTLDRGFSGEGGSRNSPPGTGFKLLLFHLQRHFVFPGFIREPLNGSSGASLSCSGKQPPKTNYRLRQALVKLTPGL